jgi:hypothetical protein
MIEKGVASLFPFLSVNHSMSSSRQPRNYSARAGRDGSAIGMTVRREPRVSGVTGGLSR